MKNKEELRQGWDELEKEELDQQIRMKELKEELADHELSAMLREKGFDGLVRTCFHPNYGEYESSDLENWNQGWAKGYYSRPRLSLAQTWLRVVHDIHVLPVLHQRWIDGYGNYTDGYGYECTQNITIKASKKIVGSYEQALSEGIKEGLKLIEKS